MEFSMTGEEKGDFLIEVTAWVDLTVQCLEGFQRKMDPNLLKFLRGFLVSYEQVY